MEQRAKKYVEDHKNPLIKPEFPATKLLVPSGSEDELGLTRKTIDELFKVVDKERVERRCARGEALWNKDRCLAKVTRNRGHLNNFGFGENKEKFLFPEETLFLIEMNRLELLWHDVPLSLEKSYQILLDSNMTIPKYKGYKKLVEQGYRLVRREVFEKRKHQVQPMPSSKRRKIEGEDDAQPSCSNPQKETENYLFAKLQQLRELGPKTHQTETKIDYDYKVFLPENHSRLEPDYNLYIREETRWRPEIGFMDNSIGNLVCFTGLDTPAFFEIGTVELPFLN